MASNTKPRSDVRLIFTAEVTTSRIVVPNAEDRRFLGQAGIAFATLPRNLFNDLNVSLKPYNLRLKEPMPWAEVKSRIKTTIQSRYPGTTFGPRVVHLEDTDSERLDDKVDTVRSYLSTFSLRCVTALNEIVRVKATGKVARMSKNSLLATGAAEKVFLAELKFGFDDEQQTPTETVNALQEVGFKAGGHKVTFSLLPPVGGVREEVLQVRMAPTITVGGGVYENNATASTDMVLTDANRRQLVAFAQELIKRFS